MSEHTAVHTHTPTYGIYVLVWLALVGLTSITVALAGFKLSNMTVITALGIASIKSVLVAYYFMHVRADSKVFKVFILICLVIFLVMIALTFSDVIFRNPVK